MANTYIFLIFQEVDLLGNHCHFFHLIFRHVYCLSFLRRSLSLSKASSAGVSLILKVGFEGK